MTDRPSVVYVLPDKMGGSTNIIANLLQYRRPDAFTYDAVLTHNHLHTDRRFGQPLAADTQTTVEYTLPVENLYAVMRRVARAIPPRGGVYVAGDLLDLAVASAHDFGRAVIHMLHGDIEYYYDLAVRHEPIVHAFIAYSRRMHDELVARLPHRADTIFHLPYGIPIPAAVRRPIDGPLRLIYGGRFEQRQKGVFDLPEIDRALQAMGASVSWTVAGMGPDEEELKRRWAFNPRVRWMGTLTNAALLDLYQQQDVFVLPTRFEGFPVAMVEAMAAGLPAVVSDIPSGVPEVRRRSGERRAAAGRGRAGVRGGDRPARSRSGPSRGDERRGATGRREPVRHSRSSARLPGTLRALAGALSPACRRLSSDLRQPPRSAVDTESPGAARPHGHPIGAMNNGETLRSVATAQAKRLAGPAIATKVRCLMRGHGLPRWGNLRRTVPFSSTYGFERGTPIDRHYLHRVSLRASRSDHRRRARDSRHQLHRTVRPRGDARRLVRRRTAVRADLSFATSRTARASFRITPTTACCCRTRCRISASSIAVSPTRCASSVPAGSFWRRRRDCCR